MILFAMAACAPGQKNDNAMGLDLTDMDTTVAPGEDFYLYACGGWMKNNPLKGEYARFGSFDQLRENNKEQLRTLVEELSSKQNEKGSVAQKIADIYNMEMDSVRRNELGSAPIKADIEAIEAIKDK